MKDLNDNEKKVLNKIIKASVISTGGEFTDFDELMEEITLFTENQVKGYLSQLQKKKYISICEEFLTINPGEKYQYLNYNRSFV